MHNAQLTMHNAQLTMHNTPSLRGTKQSKKNDSTE